MATTVTGVSGDLIGFKRLWGYHDDDDYAGLPLYL